MRDAALALVGEVEVAVRGEVEVVQALEGLRVQAAQHDLVLAGLRIEADQAELVVADEDAAILVELHPVGPAVELRDEIPAALRIDAEDAAEGNVDDPEVSFAIEGGAL